MNTDRLVNKPSCSHTSFDVQLLKPSDTLLFTGAGKSEISARKLQRKTKILQGISFAACSSNNLGYPFLFFMFSLCCIVCESLCSQTTCRNVVKTCFSSVAMVGLPQKVMIPSCSKTILVSYPLNKIQHNLKCHES